MGPTRPQGQGGGRPAHDNAQRPPGKGPRPSRPPGERHNFDEVQPQSNANAAPFGRTLSAPGGAPRGHGNDSGPRHRSGPRAPKGGHGNANGGYGNSHGSAPSRTYAGAEDKRQSGGPGARAPGRVAPRVEVRYKVVRHEGNIRIPSKPEASGNVAPVADKPQVHDDDD